MATEIQVITCTYSIINTEHDSLAGNGLNLFSKDPGLNFGQGTVNRVS
jgi:hypothetical protein